MKTLKTTLLAGIMISICGCMQDGPDSTTPLAGSLTWVKREAAWTRFQTCIETWTRVERRCGSQCTIYGSEGAEKYLACLSRSGLQRHAG